MANIKTASQHTSRVVHASTRQSFVLPVDIAKEHDGRWSANVPLLPGCASWGASWQDALRQVKEAAEGYIAVLIEDGRVVPNVSRLPKGPMIIAEV